MRADFTIGIRGGFHFAFANNRRATQFIRDNSGGSTWRENRQELIDLLTNNKFSFEFEREGLWS